MKKKLDSSLVTVTVDVINTTGVEGRRTTDDAMNLWCWFDEIMRDIGRN